MSMPERYAVTPQRDKYPIHHMVYISTRYTKDFDNLEDAKDQARRMAFWMNDFAYGVYSVHTKMVQEMFRTDQ